MIDDTSKGQAPEKVEYDLPNSYQLTQLDAVDNDPQQLEGFIMEDAGIPLNMRLVQTNDDDDGPLMDTYNQEDVPFTFDLVHFGNEEDGELMIKQIWVEMKNNRLQWWTDTYLSTITV